MFEVEYRDANGDRRVRRRVQSWNDARSIGRELAKATGYRTIIRRDRDELWDVMMLTMDSLELLLVEDGVPTERAKAFWEQHDYAKCRCVAVLWPSGKAWPRPDTVYASQPVGQTSFYTVTFSQSMWSEE